MARVTVEDCLEHVDNRFQLVLVTSKRARQLANGQESHVPWDNDKPTVVALREVAEGYVGPGILDEIDMASDPFIQSQGPQLNQLAAHDAPEMHSSGDL